MMVDIALVGAVIGLGLSFITAFGKISNYLTNVKLEFQRLKSKDRLQDEKNEGKFQAVDREMTDLKQEVGKLFAEVERLKSLL